MSGELIKEKTIYVWVQNRKGETAKIPMGPMSIGRPIMFYMGEMLDVIGVEEEINKDEGPFAPL